MYVWWYVCMCKRQCTRQTSPNMTVCIHVWAQSVCGYESIHIYVYVWNVCIYIYTYLRIYKHIDTYMVYADTFMHTRMLENNSKLQTAWDSSKIYPNPCYINIRFNPQLIHVVESSHHPRRKWPIQTQSVQHTLYRKQAYTIHSTYKRPQPCTIRTCRVYSLYSGSSPWYIFLPSDCIRTYMYVCICQCMWAFMYDVHAWV